MAQKISQMTEQTTTSMTEAGTSDFLGGYTTTGGNANRKFSLSGLANYFLNKFKLTLGGSSQTVKSAIDALNSNLLDGNWKNGIDLNAYKTTQTLLVRDATNKPPEITDEIWGALDVIGRNDYCTQWLSRMGSTWTREYRNGVWGAWVQDPTRAEITGLSSKTQCYTAAFNMNASTKITLTATTIHQIYAIFASGYTGKTLFVICSNGVCFNLGEYGTASYIEGGYVIDLGATYRRVMIISSDAINYTLS